MAWFMLPTAAAVATTSDVESDTSSGSSGGRGVPDGNDDPEKNNRNAIQVDVQDEILQALGPDDPMVGAIDQGTSSTRFLVFTRQGRVLASAQMEHTQYYPEGEDKTGWHEHDPLEIYQNTLQCMQAVQDALQQAGVDLCTRKLAALGMTNQRETTVAWNKRTGVPYYRAIVWDDTRTSHIAHQVAAGNVNRLRAMTGLPIASYFAGTKVAWLVQHVPELQDALRLQKDDVAFGTIDSWLVYQLTGTPSAHEGAANANGQHVTDVTNASRWLFMELESQQWRQDLIDQVVQSDVSVPVSTLPQILPSSYDKFATLSSSEHKKNGIPAMLDGVPLTSVLGDQHAALFGQLAFDPGMAKNTYGTGLFMLLNTGPQAVASRHGLLTTIAYQIGHDRPQYALEGSVSHSGSTVQWLRDQLQIISSAAETERLATSHNDGLYLVPAFAGLFAPYWDASARGVLTGLTASHHKGHVVRAALESTAYQTYDVFAAMQQDANIQLDALKVDGGGTANNLMMQFQADLIQVPVHKPVVRETTALGAALAAGLAVQVWRDLDELRGLAAVAQTFTPNMPEHERAKNLAGWQRAVQRSKNWLVEDENDEGGNMSTTTADNAPQCVLLGAKKGPWTTLHSMLPAPVRDEVKPEHAAMAVCTVLALLVGYVAGKRRR